MARYVVIPRYRLCAALSTSAKRRIAEDHDFMVDIYFMILTTRRRPRVFCLTESC